LSLDKNEQGQITEAEAWRTIGEAYEARVAHPDLKVDSGSDLAFSGLCSGLATMREKERITRDQHSVMWVKVNAEVDSPENHVAAGYNSIMLHPRPTQDGGSEFRATLAYLFAEAAK
jgi:hypothetical protein